MNCRSCLVVGVVVLAGLALGRADPPPADTSPNLLIEVQSRVAGALADMPIDRTEPVRDNILKTDIHGMGHTVGRTRVEFVPCDVCGVFDLIMEARNDAQTVGYHGPVRLYNTSESLIVARKRVCADANGLRTDPAVSANQTQSTLQGIDTRFRLRPLDNMVRRSAYRRYERDKELARMISENHVDQRVQERLNRDVAVKIAAGNQAIADKVRGPLEKRGLYPDRVSLRTTATALFVYARLADPKAGPFAPPPNGDPTSDLTVRAHESAVNAIAERYLGGKTYAETKDGGEPFPDALRPPRSRRDTRQDFAITFARERPVECRFDDNRATITFRVVKSHSEQFGDQGPMDITATYRLEKTAEGFRGIRQGEIQVQLSDAVKGKTTRAGMKALVANHLDDFLNEELGVDAIALPDEWKKVGPLLPTQFGTARGWLVLGVRRGTAK